MISKRKIDLQLNPRLSWTRVSCFCLAMLLFIVFSAVSLTSSPARAENDGSSNIPISVENGGAVPPILLSDDQQNPAIIDLPDKNKWFVVWEDWRNVETSGVDIYGRFINADGTLCGNEIAISTAPGNQTVPTIAYRNSATGADNIMIAWQDSRGDTSSGYIYYNFLDISALNPVCSAGAVLREPKIIVYKSINRDRLISRKIPKIAYDKARDQFWMVWVESRDQVQRLIEYPFGFYGVPRWDIGDANYIAYTTISASSANAATPEVLRNLNGSSMRTVRMIASTSKGDNKSRTVTYEYEYFTDINNVTIACDSSSPEALIAWEGVRGKATLTCKWTDKDKEEICHTEQVDDGNGGTVDKEICEPNPDYGKPSIDDDYTSDLTLESVDGGKKHIYSIFDKYINQSVVHSRRLDAADVPSYSPALGFDPVHSKFLAAWESANEGDGVHSSIFGQLIYSGGGLYGSNIFISYQDLDGNGEVDDAVKTSNQTRPSIALDSSNQRFFVSWQDGRNAGGSFAENDDIYGQFVDSVGSLQGANYAVCLAEGNQYSPVAAFNQASYKFLSVWKDSRNSGISNSDIYGEIFTTGQSQLIVLDADGALLSPPIYDFSSVKVGEVKTVTLTLKNPGDSTVIIDAVTPLTKPFCYLDLPAELVSVGDGAEMDLLPGSSFTVSIQFTPDSMGVFFDKFSTISNATDLTVNIQGQGDHRDVYVAPMILDFLTMEVGESSVLNVVITNNSTEDVQLKGAVTENKDFKISGVEGGEIISSGGGTLTYQVTFTPTETGNVQSQLSMSVGPVQDWANIPAEEVDWGTAYGVVLKGTVNADFDQANQDTFTADNTYKVTASASTSKSGKLFVLVSHVPLSSGKIYALTSDGTLKLFPYWDNSGWQNFQYQDSAAPGMSVDLSKVDFRVLGCTQCQGGTSSSQEKEQLQFGDVVITPSSDDGNFNNALDFKYMPGSLYIVTYVKDTSVTEAFDFNKDMLEFKILNINSFAGTWRVTSSYNGENRVHPSNLVVTENGDGNISAVWPGYNIKISYGKPDESGYVITFAIGIYNYTYKITKVTTDTFSGTYSCVANGQVLEDAPVSGVRLK